MVTRKKTTPASAKPVKAGPSANTKAKTAQRKRRNKLFNDYVKACAGGSVDGKGTTRFNAIRGEKLAKLRQELDSGKTGRFTPLFTNEIKKVKDKNGVLRNVRQRLYVDGKAASKRKQMPMSPSEIMRKTGEAAKLEALIAGSGSSKLQVDRAASAADTLRPAFMSMLAKYAVENGVGASALQAIGIPNADLIEVGLLEAPAAAEPVVAPAA